MGSYDRLVKRVARAGVNTVPAELKQELKSRLNSSLKPDLKAELKPEIMAELKAGPMAELKAELRAELRAELETELKAELLRSVGRLHDLPGRVAALRAAVGAEGSANPTSMDAPVRELRRLVRSAAGLTVDRCDSPAADDLLAEISFLHCAAHTLKPAFDALASRRVLFCGQSYYNVWYLSRALRHLGWKADVYNWDSNPANWIYYHGEDYRLGGDIPEGLEGELDFYLLAIYGYDVFHFSNAHGIAFGWGVQSAVAQRLGMHAEIHLLKALGKKVVYSHNGCLDGVSQTAFSKWGPESVCSICRWQHEPSVCSDERNLAWGRFRNSVADFQCTLGGNRVDCNADRRVHEVPEFYCLDPGLWHPEMAIPEQYRLPSLPDGGVRLYHAVGRREERTRSDGVNIKSSHVYLPLIERFRTEGLVLDLIEPTGIPNREVRFLQAQADIFLDMLTYGWFGANIREAMMLAKPVICFIRPEWLESVREELPDYAEELPIVSATPDTVESVLRDLIADPEKRREIGRRSRDFALKWHSASAGAARFDRIYGALLAGDPLLRRSA
ncbi:MAG: hypothetical protein AW08_00095 [Candidatus Accumulibacter adjunctus]|uniref:Uncharacterized protein n=1 Tax=Candidatus Accumulibacter adjunctus TaxID=1454001 RepID=A0A011NY80_9PROT|nr:MAG: hypothetical protein AW08_00095 [Candidatus Accumulibacter adjunctus]